MCVYVCFVCMSMWAYVSVLVCELYIVYLCVCLCVCNTLQKEVAE